ncbi:MAG: hypothetical protein IJP07_05005, partial [Firmicutes bacterium]|nr:hypothetical protein [Bacillota bacterium]
RAVLSAETWLEDCHVAKLGLAVASPQFARLAMTILWVCASQFRTVAWDRSSGLRFKVSWFFFSKKNGFTSLLPAMSPLF